MQYGEPLARPCLCRLKPKRSASHEYTLKRICVNDDIKDVMGEAKGRGYDTKAIRTIIRLRKKDANERIEEETILQTYMAALGME
ncbi:hypothetical protein (DUF2312) [Rhizobium sp. 9140]|nr:hypothetical protein (DUF2312) [Rhizobium sp. 9140]